MRPTARSTTFPREINSRNSLIMREDIMSNCLPKQYFDKISLKKFLLLLERLIYILISFRQVVAIKFHPIFKNHKFHG